MNQELQHLIKRLKQDGDKTAAFFGSLEPQAWRAQVYTTGSEWTVRDVLAHFVSAERSFKELVNDVAAGGKGAPRDLMIDDFNETEVPKLGPLSPEELLDAYRSARRASIELAMGLDPNVLDLRGYHPWFGDVEIRAMLKLVYRHNMIHLRDIRSALKSGAPTPHKDIDPPTAR
ncbi:MAG: maleylpyruvate isomerase N-terminal domain-containing protein [Anaerolineales bacterium]